ncbi:MAG: hypothetical protein GY817_07870 [bacterium]|nr:hypothetical protein [bacterium]
MKIGEVSRGGQTRGYNKALDHDMQINGTHTPFGIVNENTGELYIGFGSSYKTSDFVVDELKNYWDTLSQEVKDRAKVLQIKLDNGPENSGVRTQFLKRIIEFCDTIGKTVQLLYFPPYHSKYNPIERCWGVLEIHWNGALLSNARTMINWAKSMTWKGISPLVTLSHKIYEKGIKLTKKEMKKYEKRLQRNPNLPKWDILIEPLTPGEILSH